MVKDWKRVKIGELLDFKNGLNKGKDFFGSGTPIINYMDVYKKNGLHSADITGKVSLDEKEIKRYEVKKGDVFFTRTSETPEEVGIASVLLDDIDACVFSGFVLRGRPKTDMLLPEYCKYCFSTHEVRQKIIASCTYTTRALTNGTQLSKIEISVPDKDEQFRIVSSLTEVDQLIDKSEKLVKKYQDLKQACLQHMFPRAGQTEPDVRLPGFTGPWEQRKLGKLVEFYNGDRSSRYPNDSDMVSEGVPFINAGDLVSGRVKLDTANKITEEKFNELSGAKIQRGDIIYCLRGTLGKNAFVDNFDVGTVASSLVDIRPKKVVGKYLYQVLNSDIEYTQRIVNDEGAAQPNLSAKNLSLFNIPMPDEVEQEKIAAYFDDLDNLITLHQRTCEKYKKIKQGMMEELLSGKIRLV